MIDFNTDAGPVGWVGTGKMGAPMAQHLLNTGVDLHVIDTQTANTRPLAAAGATVASALADIGQSCPIVFSSIPDDAALIAIVTGAAGLADTMAPGSVFIEMSTVSAKASQTAAERLAAGGIKYIRAPVSGSTSTAEAAKLTVLASGDQDAWAVVEPLIAAFSAARFWLGAGEEARYMKFVLNTLVGANAALLGEAISLGERGGLDRNDMMRVILASAVTSPLLQYKRDVVLGLDKNPAFRLDQMVKDFSLILDAANQQNADMSATSLVLDQYRAAAADGFEGHDFFALVDWICDNRSNSLTKAD